MNEKFKIATVVFLSLFLINSLFVPNVLAQTPSTMTTEPATNITPYGANLNAILSLSYPANVWFQYATSGSTSCDLLAYSTLAQTFSTNTSNTPYSRTISGLTPSRTYYYCVFAWNTSSGGNAAIGIMRQFTTAAEPERPTTPTNLSTNIISSSQINLSWTASTDNVGVVRYDIYRNGVKVGESTTTSYSNTGLTANASYNYYVLAYDAAGNSSLSSNIVYITLTPTPPSVTTNIPVPANTNQYQLGLDSTVNPNGSSTSTWYRYGTTNTNDCATLSSVSAFNINVGSGTTPVSGIRGAIGQLSSNTIYYYCAVAQNSFGLRYGSIQQGTTLQDTAESLSTATTQPATNITKTQATLNGTLSLSYFPINAFFWFGSTPGNGYCQSLSFSTITTLQQITTSTSNTPYSTTLSGLTPGSTYYFCAHARQSSGGDNNHSGIIRQFTTLTDTQPPTAPINLHSIAISESQIELYWSPSIDDVGVVRYDIYRNGVKVIENTWWSINQNGEIAHLDTGLTYGTYSYYVKAVDGSGNVSSPSNTTTHGTTDTTSPTSPTNLSATAISSSQINLSWTASTDNVGVVRYDIYRNGVKVGESTTTAYSNTGLTANASYDYYVLAHDGANLASQPSNTVTATTLNSAQLPSIISKSVTDITQSSASMNTTVNPNGLSTSVWLKYGTTNTGCSSLNNETIHINISPSANSTISIGVSPLTSSTPYYYCAVAQNSSGTVYSSVDPFSTTAQPSPTPSPSGSPSSQLPIIISNQITSYTLNSINVKATVNPNGRSTSVWFRYGTTNTGCSSLSNETIHSSAGIATTGISVNFSLSPLIASTTYYFCTVAQNSSGTVYSSETVWVPTLPPSNTYRRVFLTNNIYNGNLSGLQGADTKCQLSANGRGLGGKWKAWLSDSTTSATSRLSHSDVPYKLLNGTVIADDWDDLSDWDPNDINSGALQNRINIDQLLQAQVSSTDVWTCTNPNGGRACSDLPSGSCQNWTSDNAGSSTSLYGTGHALQSNYLWTHNATSRTCDNLARLYCFEQDSDLPLTCGDYGDVNGDQRISYTDSELVLASFAGTQTLTLDQQRKANVTNNASYNNPANASSIDQYINGVISTFPICSLASSSTATKHPVINCGGITNGTGNCDQSVIDLALGENHIFYVNGNLNITGNISGLNNNNVGVVFVERDLYINPPSHQIVLTGGNSGLVFVVKGNINIDQSVTRIDSVLISEGVICTASEGTPPTCPTIPPFTNPTTTSQLVINGSLISIKKPVQDDSNPQSFIRFRRTLSNNSEPAEKINHEIKYLVILRKLVSDTYQKWSEIP